jgi:prefoldin subunit 5
MARRRSEPDTMVVSLFPFLSILSCVIGTLTLLIAGLTAGAMSSDDEGIARTEEYVRIEEERAQLDTDSTETEQLIAQAQALAEKLKAARAQLAVLELQRDETDAAEGLVIDLLAQINVLEERIAELQARIVELKRLIAEVELELGQRVADVERSKGSVRVLPPQRREGTTDIELTPIFVECTETGVTLNAELSEAGQRRIPEDDISDDRKMKAYFKKLKKSPDAIVIFLIRPGGIESFQAVQAVVSDVGIRNGKIPVPGHQQLDLGLFGELEAGSK